MCGCGCCDGACDKCCGCIDYGVRENLKAGCLCFGIVAAVVLIVVLVVAYGFVRHVSIVVEDASLTSFALATTPVTALACNLSLRLTVRNPNWAMSIKNTEPFMAAYKFDGQQFDRVLITDKGKKHPARKTRVYRLVTNSGNNPVSLGNAGVAEYKKENATSPQVFEVEVALTGEVRYTARTTKCKLEASCPLKLQLAPPGTPAAVFQQVKCKLAKPEKNC